VWDTNAAKKKVTRTCVSPRQMAFLCGAAASAAAAAVGCRERSQPCATSAAPAFTPRAAGALPSPSGSAPSVQFYVLHNSHEGSHGIGDKLIRTRCVNFFINEYFDASERNGITTARQQLDALRTFFSTPLIANLKLATVLPQAAGHMIEERVKLWRDQVRLFDAGCPCEARGVLLRASAQTLCQLPGTKPYILVRTDLLRWSLSVYSDRYLQAMPQFFRTKNGTAYDALPPKQAFDVGALGEIADSLVQNWRKKADLYTKLSRCGLRPRLITFEAFEDTQELPSGLSMQLLPCEQRKPPPARTEYSSVRIVHSHRISEFVNNSDEVHAFFTATPYPTFAEVFASQANVTAAGLMALLVT